MLWENPSSGSVMAQAQLGHTPRPRPRLGSSAGMIVYDFDVCFYDYMCCLVSWLIFVMFSMFLFFLWSSRVLKCFKMFLENLDFFVCFEFLTCLDYVCNSFA
jgi:hypothetical protein